MSTFTSQPLRVAVTGASGFIGGPLVQYLAGQGHTVLALARRPIQVQGVAAATVSNYEDVAALTALFHGHDAVIHLAALAHRQAASLGDAEAVAAAFAGNVRSTRAVAQACLAAGVRRLVLLSSIGVNGRHSTSAPFTETTPAEPTEPYAISKLQAEQAMQQVLAGQQALDYVIIRPPLVYGPHAPGNFAQLLRTVARGWWLPLGRARALRSFVGLGNLVDFITRCAQHPAARNQLYLIADGHDVSTADFIRHIAQALGQPARLLHVPLALLRTLAAWAGRAEAVDKLTVPLQIDCGKAHAQLGWVAPYTLDQGLQQAAAPLRANTANSAEYPP
jgi:nucleoside-diphosphate-sugar epimerase